MSQENRSDPWDEVEGIPPLVERIYRTPPGEERSWLTRLHEIEGLVNWLADHMMDLRVSIEQAFDAYLAENIPDSVEMAREIEGAFKVHGYIGERVDRRVEGSSAVQELLLRLIWKLRTEIPAPLRRTEEETQEVSMKDERARLTKAYTGAWKEWNEFVWASRGSTLTSEMQERRRLLEERLKQALERKIEADWRWVELLRQSND